MYEIQRLHIGSVVKMVTFIATLLYLMVGVVIAVLFESVRGLLAGTFLATSTGAMSFLLVWLAGTLVVILISIIIGFAIAGFYNMFAAWWGGIRIDLAKAVKRGDTHHEHATSDHPSTHKHS